MTNYVYFIVLLSSIIVPFIASFHPKLQFHKRFKYFAFANIPVTIFFLIWDAIFTQKSVWGFSSKYTLGLNIRGLPIEEILFFIVIPFCCIFSYHCFGVLSKKLIHFKTTIISIIIVLLLTTTAIIYHNKLYTFYTSIFTVAFVIITEWALKPAWRAQLYFTYFIMLLPFLIVNGVLTGFGLEEPVVWYNSQEIIGIRIITIPIEDVFYGFLLIGANITLYELFASKTAK